MNDTISFACTACGRCCNSPPRLSLPELFRFQHVFIGCLAVSRLAARDAAQWRLFDRLALRAPGPGGATHLAIMPQGYGYDSETHCPALAADGGCTLHHGGKPGQCAAVPLDPLAPDAQQGAVLRERMQDRAFGAAGCLTDDGDMPLTSGARVEDARFAAALGARRAAIAADMSFWGHSVLAFLQRHGALDVPQGGYLALPMSAALLAAAGFSAACRDRCVTFIDAQLDLITQATQGDRPPRDRAATRRLLGWADGYRGLRRTLAAPASWLPAAQAQAREAWLGATDALAAPSFMKVG